MDSTFIGQLIAIDRRLKNGLGGRLHIIQASTKCLDQLRALGLLDFLVFDSAPIAPPSEMEEIDSASGRLDADFVLRAHQQLMDTSEIARKKFSLLRNQLEHKLKNGNLPEGNH